MFVLQAMLCYACPWPQRKTRQQYTCNVTIRCISLTVFAVEIATIITYTDCVSVALVIQHASACAVLHCSLWPVRLHQSFLRCLKNVAIFGGKIIGFYLQLLSGTFIF